MNRIDRARSEHYKKLDPIAMIGGYIGLNSQWLKHLKVFGLNTTEGKLFAGSLFGLTVFLWSLS